MHETHQRGSVAEAAIALAALRAGFGVLKPLNDGERYDLVLDLRTRLVRVQCKAATQQGEVIVVRCRSGRRTRHGVVMRQDTSDEIDAFAAYCEEFDRCFFLPIERFDRRTAISLRLGQPRNNQKLRVNWADDYDLESMPLHLWAQGAVAQLGERRAGSA
jgi:PD-(D/E)XK endonuclease